MKIGFFGTAEFAVPILRAIAPSVIHVVSQPDRPSGRGLQLRPSPVKAAGAELGLPVHTPDRARDPQFVEELRSWHLDALVVAAYGQILPQSVLDATRLGAFNLHGSVLPKYRGAAPIQRCLLAGDRETGVTLMQMDKGMDSGDIIAIEPLPILEGETYGELQERLARKAADLTLHWLPRLDSGDYPRTPQNPEAATYAPKVDRAEGLLDFQEDARRAHCRYRAFSPSPGVWMDTRFGRVKVGRASFDEREGLPGTFVAPDSVAFLGGSLRLLEVQPEGKKRMSGSDFANGFRLRHGDSLR